MASPRSIAILGVVAAFAMSGAEPRRASADGEPVEFFDRAGFAAATENLTVIGFDALATGNGVLVGDEFLAQGLTIVNLDGFPMNVVANTVPGSYGFNFVTEGNLASAPNAISASTATESITLGRPDRFEFRLTVPAAAAGVFVGNLPLLDGGFVPARVEFLDALGNVLASEDLTASHAGVIVGTAPAAFDTRVFCGLVSDTPIAVVRVLHPGGETIVIDDVQFGAAAPPPVVTEYFTRAAFGRNTGSSTVIDFDDRTAGDGALTGGEYTAQGVTIVQRKGLPINVVENTFPGWFGANGVAEGHIASPPNAISSSVSAQDAPDCDDGASADHIDFVFPGMASAAGLWIGGLGGLLSNPDAAVRVEFVDADGRVLASEDLTRDRALAARNQQAVQPGFALPDFYDNRMFYGIDSSVPIERVRVTGDGSGHDQDGIVIDSVEFVAPTAPGAAVEFFDRTRFTAAAGVLTVIGFDEWAPGAVLTGDEYATVGLSISEPGGHPLTVLEADYPYSAYDLSSPYSDNRYCAGNRNSSRNGFGGSAFPYRFVFAGGTSAAGLFLGHLGNRAVLDGSTTIEFLDAGGVVLASEVLNRFHGGVELHGIFPSEPDPSFCNRVFYGITSTTPIAEIRLKQDPLHFDSDILIDDIQFVSTLPPPEPAAPIDITISRTTVNLDFARPNLDSATVHGTIRHTGLLAALEGRRLGIDLGGYVRSFGLHVTTKKGKQVVTATDSIAPGEPCCSLALSTAPVAAASKGTKAEPINNLRFVLTLNRVDLVSALADEGFRRDSSEAVGPRQFRFGIALAGLEAAKVLDVDGQTRTSLVRGPKPAAACCTNVGVVTATASRALLALVADVEVDPTEPPNEIVADFRRRLAPVVPPNELTGDANVENRIVLVRENNSGRLRVLLAGSFGATVAARLRVGDPLAEVPGTTKGAHPKADPCCTIAGLLHPAAVRGLLAVAGTGDPAEPPNELVLRLQGRLDQAEPPNEIVGDELIGNRIVLSRDAKTGRLGALRVGATARRSATQLALGDTLGDTATGSWSLHR